MKIPQDVGWGYWLMTIPWLIIGLTIWRTGFVVTMILTIIQVAHFARREDSITGFPVQIRIAYLGALRCHPFRSERSETKKQGAQFDVVETKFASMRINSCFVH